MTNMQSCSIVGRLARLGCCSGALLLACHASAAVKVAPVFGDHMVFQRDLPVPVWGTADAGERVTVSAGGHEASATADGSGKWATKLPALKTSADPVEVTVSGDKGGEKVTFKDVLVGEVWIASGQSNMEWIVRNSKDFEQEKASADYPQIRMFTVQKAVAAEPTTELKGDWKVTTPENVGNFSAVGYFFARELHKQLGIPIGIIHTSWGGTPAESWAEASALESRDSLKPIGTRWRQQAATYTQRQAQWQQQAEQAKAEGKRPPNPPTDPQKDPWRPSGLYNAMIAPLVPYAVRGSIWYQGESNAGRAYQYRELLPAMIGTWRKAWGRSAEEFPFLIVQLANFTDPPKEPGDSDWAELREAQSMTAAQPGNGIALAIDIGEAKDIHPKNKQEVGRRLALVALHDVYGKTDLAYSGPAYDSMKVDGDAVRLTFKHADGLAAKGGDALKGFAVAGEDHQWHWADAKVEGNQVVVHSDEVKHPVAVRYAWANNPEGANLVNGAGLPASPFRTDDWKGKTADAR